MQNSPSFGFSEAEQDIRSLYAEMLRRWNERDSAGVAALFTVYGSAVGFDGSQLEGPAQIQANFRRIFAQHPTAAYVGKVREVCLLSMEAALLRAVAGMVPPERSDLNPALNMIHSLVATKLGETWRIQLFQSTPATLHGQSEASEALTLELRRELELQRGHGAN